MDETGWWRLKSYSSRTSRCPSGGQASRRSTRMSDQPKVVRAELQQLSLQGQVQKKIPVQFNPETLKVSYANQVVPPTNSGTPPAPADDRGSATMQFVGRGTTKLSVQLWFDVNAILPTDKDGVSDVRVLTHDVVNLITPQDQGKDKFL